VWIRCLLIIALLIGSACWEQVVAAEVSLGVLNPRGELPPLKSEGLSPRVADLAGKRIALVANYKAGAELFLTKICDLLKEKYPTATFLRFKLEKRPKGDTKGFSEIANQCDVFIHSTGD
jgi:hypothetical protein